MPRLVVRPNLTWCCFAAVALGGCLLFFALRAEKAAAVEVVPVDVTVASLTELLPHEVDLPPVALPSIDLPPIDVPPVAVLDLPPVDLPAIEVPPVDLPAIEVPGIEVPTPSAQPVPTTPGAVGARASTVDETPEPPASFAPVEVTASHMPGSTPSGASPVLPRTGARPSGTEMHTASQPGTAPNVPPAGDSASTPSAPSTGPLAANSIPAETTRSHGEVAVLLAFVVFILFAIRRRLDAIALPLPQHITLLRTRPG